MEGNPCSYILIRSTDIYILDILLMIKQIENIYIYIYIYSGNIFHICYLGEENKQKMLIQKIGGNAIPSTVHEKV